MLILCYINVPMYTVIETYLYIPFFSSLMTLKCEYRSPAWRFRPLYMYSIVREWRDILVGCAYGEYSMHGSLFRMRISTAYDTDLIGIHWDPWVFLWTFFVNMNIGKDFETIFIEFLELGLWMDLEGDEKVDHKLEK